MSGSSWVLPVGIAAGVLIAVAPSLLTRLRAARRISRGLAADQRALEVSPEQLMAYDARVVSNVTGDTLDDTTWADLGLDDVFRRLDRCVSQPGRQVLYHMVRRASLDAATASSLDTVVTSLQQDHAAMDTIRDALTPLRRRSAAYLQAAAFGALPERPWFWWLFPLLTVLSVTMLAAMLVWPPAFIVWIVVCAITMVAQLWYRPTVREYVPAMSALPDLIVAARSLGAMRVAGLEAERAALRDGAARIGALRSTTAWLRFDGALANELAGSLYEYGNLLFALDLSAFVLTTSRLRAERTAVQAMFRALGHVDAVRSIAVWRDSLETWCAPSFAPRSKSLRLRAMSHPLLDTPVRNTLELDACSLLLTGSNMSGKTTFLRALGVNVVLAQSLATVCAATWQVPVLRVRSSIGQADSLLEGKSFYMAEVEAVRRMVDVVASAEAQFLFLLDELFRGTNTPERVAAGCATLAWLDRGDDIVCVATHDIELHGLLGARFAAYHFREQVTNAALSFDYLIRPGLSSTRNAIALLRLTGYPAALVAAAEAGLSARGPTVTAGEMDRSESAS